MMAKGHLEILYDYTCITQKDTQPSQACSEVKVTFFCR